MNRLAESGFPRTGGEGGQGRVRTSFSDSGTISASAPMAKQWQLRLRGLLSLLHSIDFCLKACCTDTDFMLRHDVGIPAPDRLTDGRAGARSGTVQPTLRDR